MARNYSEAKLHAPSDVVSWMIKVMSKTENRRKYPAAACDFISSLAQEMTPNGHLKVDHQYWASILADGFFGLEGESNCGKPSVMSDELGELAFQIALWCHANPEQVLTYKTLFKIILEQEGVVAETVKIEDLAYGIKIWTANDSAKQADVQFSLVLY